MSYIVATLSSAVSFLAQPITAALSGISAYCDLGELQSCSERLSNTTKIVSFRSKKLEGIALKKIQLFIKNLGFDPDRIFLLSPPDAAHYPNTHVQAFDTISAAGTIKNGAKGAIFFEQRLIEEITQDFTIEHQFLIAHELGHLVHDDQLQGKLEMTRRTCISRLGIYSITMLAFFLLNSCNPYSLLAAHLMGCTASKVAEVVTQTKLNHKKELQADCWAVQQSPELAQAAIHYFEKCIVECTHYNKAFFESCKHKMRSSTNNSEKIVEASKFAFSKILLALNEITDISPTHPSFRTRIAAISTVLPSQQPAS